MIKSSIPFLPVFIFIFLLSSCKQPETVTVTEDPTKLSSPAGQQKDTAVTAAGFIQLNIGENDRISFLNPLFADNTSTLRALQLVFEGLVRYNSNETIIPAIAKEWSVSPDSLTYRFTLRSDVYYHDSNVFTNGVGRRFVARDVKYVFERMAHNSVPDHAARLFMDIKGFEPYYKEQHNVFNPAERQLSGISGIVAPNDSTVTFTLDDKDAHFLEKLASPYAVIYPREAVTGSDPAAFKSVGTGPFILSQKQGDNRYIFSRFQNYYRQNEPVLNRVDIITATDGADLAEALRNGNLHLVPQLDPVLMNRVLNADGKLNNTFSNRFDLVYTSGRTFHTLNRNAESRLSPEKAHSVIQRVDPDAFFSGVPANVIEFRKFLSGESSAGFTGSDTVNVTFVSDPFLKSFIRTLSDTLSRESIVLRMQNIRTPVRSTELYTGTYVPLYPSDRWSETSDALIGFSTRQVAIYLNSIENLTFNSFPWWIDLRTTTLPGIDNLGR